MRFVALLMALAFYMQANLTLAGECSAPLSMIKFKNILREVRSEKFPQLKNIRIIVTTFESDAYYLQAQPKTTTLLGNYASREYEVQLNLKLLDCPPSENALKSILVHEIEHIVDYTNWSNLEIIEHGIHYSIDRTFRKEYERATDLKAMKRGAANGLIEYREWLYQRLTPKQLSTKKYYYYTPEEILEWLEQNP